jgi:hypothetical protein
MGALQREAPAGNPGQEGEESRADAWDIAVSISMVTEMISGSPRGDGSPEVRSSEITGETTSRDAREPAKAGARREIEVRRVVRPIGRQAPSDTRDGHGVSRDEVRSSLKTESWIADIDRYRSRSSPGESPVLQSTEKSLD